MGKLKTFPVDLLGTAPSNKISGEVRKIVVNGDRIFIPTGGPFFTKSLKVWAGTTLLTVKKDYQAMDLNRDATIDSGKEVCNAIQIKHGATTFTLEYQVIGGEYTDMAEELASFIKGTPINDLTKLDYSKVLYKPLVFPPTAHNHVATDWIGYGESIALLDQVNGAASVGRNKIFDAVKELAKKRIEEYVQSYFDKDWVLFTDKTPTPRGHILLNGNGKKETPLVFDVDMLLDELDQRYFRNVINPLTRVGAISESFLPVTTGFFNVTSPLVSGRHTTAVAKIERNGDLLCLLPASDGEVIRYVYGYVRQWNRLHAITGFRPTNQQYRPPGLAADEEIMELQGINNQTMIASIYQMLPSGLASFKEHVIVVLNDSLLQDNHVLIRVGKSILTAVGNNNANVTYQHRPTAVRLRSGQYYVIHSPASGQYMRLKVHRVKDDGSFEIVSGWKGSKQLRTLQHQADGPDKVLGIETTPLLNTDPETVHPFSWFKSAATEGQEWIIDQNLLVEGYSFDTSHYGQNLRVHTVGDTVYCNAILANRASISSPAGSEQNADALSGASYELKIEEVGGPAYTWLRHKRDSEDDSSYLVNALTGFYKQKADNQDQFEYRVPYDMTGPSQDISGHYRNTIIALSDGRTLSWRPPASTGGLHLLLTDLLGDPTYSVNELHNGYYYNRAYRENGSRRQQATTALMNLENPSPIPLTVTCQVLNDDLMLLQDGAGNYSSGPTAYDIYGYRPSTKQVPYKTMDRGVINGYDTTDERISLGRLNSPMPIVASRDGEGNCRWSNMVFYRKVENEFTEQTVYRSVTMDFDNAKLNYEQPYVLKKRGYDQIEYVLSSTVDGDIHPVFVTWALIISPHDPSVGLLDARFGRESGKRQITLRTAAKLTWSGNELVGVVIRKDDGGFSEGDLNILSVSSPHNRFFLGSWGIQYSEDGKEAHWHGRLFTGLNYPGNVNSSSAIWSYKMTTGTDGFPKLSLYRNSANMDGRSAVAVTKRGVGIVLDTVAFGVYRVLHPFLNWDWESGESWTADNNQCFVYYTPRPTESFKIRILEEIPVQMGGVFNTIKPGAIELTDPLYSTVTDPRNKTIYIYATLNRGEAELLISEIALPESIYTTYIGKCITDAYGITEADLPPVSRLGNYRPSPTPRGSAFSASSGTANQEILLNWDADDGKVVSSDPAIVAVYWSADAQGVRTITEVNSSIDFYLIVKTHKMDNPLAINAINTTLVQSMMKTGELGVTEVNFTKDGDNGFLAYRFHVNDQ